MLQCTPTIGSGSIEVRPAWAGAPSRPSKRTKAKPHSSVLAEQLKDKTYRGDVPLPVMMKEVNRSLRDWSHYFHYRNSSAMFSQVKMHGEQRVRTQPRRRHKPTCVFPDI
jgi:hypothetical protein